MKTYYVIRVGKGKRIAPERAGAWFGRRMFQEVRNAVRRIRRNHYLQGETRAPKEMRVLRPS